MTVKLFEIRDRGTFIPCIAIKIQTYNKQNRYLLHRSGFEQPDEEHILIGPTNGPIILQDHFSYWSTRTMKTAHIHITQHFDELESGSVVDVEYILGETSEPKHSESLD